MKRCFLLVLLFSIFFITLSAQKIKGKYRSRMIDEDAITFILPQEGYKNKEMSKITYDITHSTASDSVIFNFSYTSKVPSPLDSVEFTNNEIKYSFPAKMYYIDPKKGDKWENRASVSFSAAEFKEIRTQTSPCDLIIHAKARENVPAKEYKFTISEKDWKKNTGVINKIFDVIQYYK